MDSDCYAYQGKADTRKLTHADTIEGQLHLQGVCELLFGCLREGRHLVHVLRDVLDSPHLLLFQSWAHL